MPLALIFSLDYELFGDGSGNVGREQIAPTNALLDVFDQYSAKLSLFFEYGQYMGYSRFASPENALAEDNDKIRHQLVDAVRRGHDVQLHYHPTWRNAKYIDGRFQLDVDCCDISLLPSEVIEKILVSGKCFLEELLRPVRHDYACNSFRAGAWSLQDPKHFLPLFTRLGFCCDSSVVPGSKMQNTYGRFDYRKVPHAFRAWPIRESLSSEAEDGLCYEIPIYTLRNPLAFLKYRNPKYLKNRTIVAKRYPTKICEKDMSVIAKIMKILSRNYYMADFNTMSTRTLMKMITKASSEIGETDEYVPVMLIGHSKMTHCPEQFHDLFRSISTLGNVEYWNLGEFVSTHLDDRAVVRTGVPDFSEGPLTPMFQGDLHKRKGMMP